MSRHKCEERAYKLRSLVWMSDDQIISLQAEWVVDGVDKVSRGERDGGYDRRGEVVESVAPSHETHGNVRQVNFGGGAGNVDSGSVHLKQVHSKLGDSKPGMRSDSMAASVGAGALENLRRWGLRQAGEVVSRAGSLDVAFKFSSTFLRGPKLEHLVSKEGNFEVSESKHLEGIDRSLNFSSEDAASQKEPPQEGRDEHQNAAQALYERQKSLLEQEVSSYQIDGPLNADQLFVRMVGNALQCYSAALFRLEGSEFNLTAIQSLARDISEDISFMSGDGILGWIAKNKRTLVLSPFERDARCLPYYQAEQEIKSFVGVPVFGEGEEVVGVLVADSKKRYSFSAFDEKVLTDIALLIGKEGFGGSSEVAVSEATTDERLELEGLRYLDSLRETTGKLDIFGKALSVPSNLLPRDSLAITLRDNGGQFLRSPLNEDKELEGVLKRLSFQQLSGSSSSGSRLKGHSFLCVPLVVMEQNVGCLSMLRASSGSLDSRDIRMMEKLAAALTSGMERIVLAEKKTAVDDYLSAISFEEFEDRSKELVAEHISAGSNSKLLLTEVSFGSFDDYFDGFGFATTGQVVSKLSRLVARVSGSRTLCCSLGGLRFLLIGGAREVGIFEGRLESLLTRSFAKLAIFNMNDPSQSLAEAVVANMTMSSVEVDVSGFSLDETIDRLRSGEISEMGTGEEKVRLSA